MIPSISTSVTGPLGVMHLPRFWLKNLLYAAGQLPDGYKHTTGTFDRLVIDTLGFDENAMLVYFKTEMPDYLQFEAWLRQNARHLDEATVKALNQRYSTFEMSESGSAARCQELGLAEGSLRLGVALNDLDDWSALHHEVVKP